MDLVFKRKEKGEGGVMQRTPFRGFEHLIMNACKWNIWYGNTYGYMTGTFWWNKQRFKEAVTRDVSAIHSATVVISPFVFPVYCIFERCLPQYMISKIFNQCVLHPVSRHLCR